MKRVMLGMLIVGLAGFGLPGNASAVLLGNTDLVENVAIPLDEAGVVPPVEEDLAYRAAFETTLVAQASTAFVAPPPPPPVEDPPPVPVGQTPVPPPPARPELPPAPPGTVITEAQLWVIPFYPYGAIPVGTQFTYYGDDGMGGTFVISTDLVPGYFAPGLLPAPNPPPKPPIVPPAPPIEEELPGEGELV